MSGPKFGDTAIVRDPDSGVQVSVGYSLINRQFEYRLGWTPLRPVPERLLNLPVRRMAMEICLRESRRVEAQRTYQQAIEISPEDWVGAA